MAEEPVRRATGDAAGTTARRNSAALARRGDLAPLTPWRDRPDVAMLRVCVLAFMRVSFLGLICQEGLQKIKELWQASAKKAVWHVALWLVV